MTAVDLDRDAAIQAIAALEARAAEWEHRLAVGTAAADDAELVIAASLRGADAIRAAYGVGGSSADPVDRAVMQIEATPATWRRWWGVATIKFDDSLFRDPATADEMRTRAYAQAVDAGRASGETTRG